MAIQPPKLAGARVHHDNKGEQLVRQRARDKRIEDAASDATNKYLENYPTDPNEIANNALEEEFKRLPGQQDSEVSRLVHFLGSSYSGVDIRVIAHLYDDGVDGLYEQMDSLQKAKDVAAAIVKGCEALQNGGLIKLVLNTDSSYEDRRKHFHTITGLSAQDPAEQEALTFLTREIFNPTGGVGTTLAAAQAGRRAAQIRDHQAALETSLQERVTMLTQATSGDGEQAQRTLELATLQTISVQSFREKHAVRALGHSYAKGYTRGPRTIAGSMIFTLFNEHALAGLIRAMGGSTAHYGDTDPEISLLIPDQLPPLDLTILFVNEYGSVSEMRLYGVEFLTDGNVFSIEDLLSENTMKFVCRDADIMLSRFRVGRDKASRNLVSLTSGFSAGPKKATDLLFADKEYEEYLRKIKIRRGVSSR